MDEEHWDKIVDELQEMVDAKDREDFSQYAIELGHHPYHYGTLASADSGYVVAEASSDCGDLLRFHIIIKNDRIKDMTFELEGCTVTGMAGSQTIKLVEGQTISEAKNLTPLDIIKSFGKFPPQNAHCAVLAVKVLREAINKYEQKMTNI
jgi:nitrogen fixation NifU-like protein